jgi:hypothetical protein
VKGVDYFWPKTYCGPARPRRRRRGRNHRPRRTRHPLVYYRTARPDGTQRGRDWHRVTSTAFDVGVVTVDQHHVLIAGW